VTNKNDIYQAAKLMMELYDEAAEAEAERMVDMLETSGDREGVRFWLRIGRLIELLREPAST
jgi:molybdopterin synthase catalytic subunit